jgi:acetoin utilization deacetylase AcuC-like enzyme
MRVVYSDAYDTDIGQHVLPLQKYRMVKERLVTEGIVSPAELLEPRSPSDADIARVHDPSYLKRLNANCLTPMEIYLLEIPFSETIYRNFRLMAGGTILASEAAVEDGVAVHLGGGLHHAFGDHGEGFCILNDVAIAVGKLVAEKRVRRAIIVDCDLHQGNGTAAIFRGRQDIFTFSIHQEHNYPFVKQRSNMDIGLPDGTTGKEYNAYLLKSLPAVFEEFKPQFVMFLAGADPYENDQLGMLELTKEDLKARDQIVMELARKAGVPLCVVLAGGYAWRVDDTVDIHVNTVVTAKSIFEPR